MGVYIPAGEGVKVQTIQYQNRSVTNRNVGTIRGCYPVYKVRLTLDL